MCFLFARWSGSKRAEARLLEKVIIGGVIILAFFLSPALSFPFSNWVSVGTLVFLCILLLVM